MVPIGPDERTEPPRRAGERETLESFLDYHRDTLLWKLSGLSEEEARRPLVPSGWPILALAKHLAYVERNWFRIRFSGEELPVPWTDEDPDADFRVEPGETIEQITSFYRDEIERSRAIASAASLDDVAASWPPDRDPDRRPTLRWIYVHMIEETARHNGHADIAREMIDGVTGE